ncbi:hypothetical protein QBC36DRAFT_366127 [Triangularia setosa]|uniref:Uncharacterized protein n=1 Tax=Triangularia setosa TaxID=2587417 RepID=A0AAN6VZR0_9PEZI|nr:hypothetical protein QBC36DRAFT_366127 [Podospora setosa]
MNKPQPFTRASVLMAGNNRDPVTASGQINSYNEHCPQAFGEMNYCNRQALGETNHDHGYNSQPFGETNHLHEHTPQAATTIGTMSSHQVSHNQYSTTIGPLPHENESASIRDAKLFREKMKEQEVIELKTRLAGLEAEAKVTRERLIQLHYQDSQSDQSLTPTPTASQALIPNQTNVINSISDLSKFFSADVIFNPGARDCGFPRTFEVMACAAKRLQDAIADCSKIIDNSRKESGLKQIRIGLNKEKAEKMSLRDRELMSWELLFRARDAQAECLVPRHHYAKLPKIVRYPSFEARWDAVVHYLQHCKAVVENLTTADHLDRVVAGPDSELKKRGRNNKGNTKRGKVFASIAKGSIVVNDGKAVNNDETFNDNETANNVSLEPLASGNNVDEERLSTNYGTSVESLSPGNIETPYGSSPYTDTSLVAPTLQATNAFLLPSHEEGALWQPHNYDAPTGFDVDAFDFDSAPVEKGPIQSC